jgi:hypothetical protein
MSKKPQRTDKRRMMLGFSFEKRVEAHLAAKADLLARLSAPAAKPAPARESYEEACIEMAAAVRAAIRGCGKSREQMVDRINAYFGWKAGKGNGGDKLSIHMFNHYLPKPARYPIPAALLYAIHHLTGAVAGLHDLLRTHAGVPAASGLLRGAAHQVRRGLRQMTEGR